MGVLTNAKHERFAQALADGKTASEAYVLAGYKANSGNAATLKAQQSVSKRVIEILEEREAVHKQATANAVEKAALSKTWVIERLIDNAKIAAANEDFGPSNRALELLGKELGMFIDRKEVGQPGDFERMNDDELRDYIRREAEALGLGDTLAQGQRGSRRALGKPH